MRRLGDGLWFGEFCGGAAVHGGAGVLRLARIAAVSEVAFGRRPATAVLTIVIGWLGRFACVGKQGVVVVRQLRRKWRLRLTRDPDQVLGVTEDGLLHDIVLPQSLRDLLVQRVIQRGRHLVEEIKKTLVNI